MTIQTSQLKTFGYGVAIFSTLVILSQCIMPMSNPASRWIAAHSVYIMLGYFGLGAIALLLKRPYLMLSCWAVTIGLCHFLKDATTNPFYYSEVSINQAELRIAHFDLETKTAQEGLFQQLSNLEVDLISVQSFSNQDFEERLIKNLELCFPHQHILHYKDQKSHSSYVFSKIPLEDIDSFHCEGVPYVNGFLRLDSNSQERIQFVSLHVPTEIQSDPANVLGRLEALADKCALHKSQEDAFLAFSAIPMASWSPEIRAFRTRFTLNDSRLDVDWEGSFEHIFYSNHLRCTKFETISNGVIGHYQYSRQHVATNERHKSSYDEALTIR
jgi:hypothetical protein